MKTSNLVILVIASILIISLAFFYGMFSQVQFFEVLIGLSISFLVSILIFLISKTCSFPSISESNVYWNHLETIVTLSNLHFEDGIHLNELNENTLSLNLNEIKNSKTYAYIFNPSLFEFFLNPDQSILFEKTCFFSPPLKSNTHKSETQVNGVSSLSYLDFDHDDFIKDIEKVFLKQLRKGDVELYKTNIAKIHDKTNSKFFYNDALLFFEFIKTDNTLFLFLPNFASIIASNPTFDELGKIIAFNPKKNYFMKIDLTKNKSFTEIVKLIDSFIIRQNKLNFK